MQAAILIIGRRRAFARLVRARVCFLCVIHRFFFSSSVEGVPTAPPGGLVKALISRFCESLISSSVSVNAGTSSGGHSQYRNAIVPGE